MGRRKFLLSIGAASAAITVVGAGLGSVLASRNRRGEQAAAGGPIPPQRDVTPQAQLPNAGDPLIPAPGTRPEYMPLKDHYRIDINLVPPVIDGQAWSLTVSGLARNPTTLTLRDFQTKYEPMHQPRYCILLDIF